MKCKLNLCLLAAVLFILAAGSPAIANPLIEAAWKGDTVKVRVLLVKGADINAKDKEGFTALMCAAMCGYTDIVQVLLAKGADVNGKNKNSDTALSLAAKEDHEEIVRSLKEAGANE